MRVQDDRTLGELFSELSNESSRLVRQEIALAKRELSDKVSNAGKDVAMIAAGALVAYAGFVIFLGFIVFALYLLVHIALWLSALIVALVVLGVGYFLIQNGLSNLKHADLAPKRTLETLRQDGQMIKQEVR